MTQLFIDEQEVVLPEKFSVKMVKENPFFTKSGDYSLNIKLSLMNPINAAIYKYVNRINCLSEMEGRGAVLIADAKVILNGKEVILNYSNTEVELQLVAGNSDLNYVIGSSLRLQDLDMGKAVIDKATIESNLSKPYPQNDWLLLPFYDPETNFIGNRYTYEIDGQGNYNLKYAYNGLYINTIYFFDDPDYWKLMTGQGVNWLMKYENYRPQPYLCFLINRVLETLGYEVKYNALAEHAIYKSAYMVHGQDTLEWAKMFPEWSVDKFLGEVEKLFDCTIVVNNKRREAELLFNSNFFENRQEVELQALDDFEVELEDDDDKMIFEKNMGYNFPESVYFKYQNIDPKMMEGYIHLWRGGANDTEAIDNISILINGLNMDFQRQNIVYRSANFEITEFIDPITKKVSPMVINDYKPIIQDLNKESMDETFDIIPAEFAVVKYITRGRESYDTDKYMMLQLPVVKAEEASNLSIMKDNKVLQPRIQSYIEGAELKKDEDAVEGRNKMMIAFYTGQRWLHRAGAPLGGNIIGMPLCFVRGISENVVESSGKFVNIMHQNQSWINPLSLEFLKKEFYSKNLRIDKSKVFKIKFLNMNLNDLDATSVFIIRNRKFYCKKIELQVTDDGIDEICEGEFYTLKN